MRARVLGLALLGIIVLAGSAMADPFQAELTGKDKELRMDYRYKISLYFPEWNDSAKTFQTRVNVYYAKHWELDESKKYSSLEENYLDGPTAYLEYKERRVKALNGVYWDEKGSRNEFSGYDYSVGGESGYKIVIVDMDDSRVVWRSYDWEPF